MSVAVILITHSNVGNAILKTVQTTLGELPLPTKAVCVAQDSDPDEVANGLLQTIKDQDQGDGVLLLTDMYGSTPSNVAKRLIEHSQSSLRLLAGVNVPMLLRIMNYSQLSLDELADKALTGAKEGILDCQQNQP